MVFKVPVTWAMTLGGTLNPMGYRMNAALIKGAINEVPVAYLEFLARNKNLELGELVGSEMGFWIADEDGKRQPFWGVCISAECKGAAQKEGIFVAEIRPWLWFLTRTRNNRIFQEKSTIEIVKDILGEYGFSGDLKVNHTGSDPVREYCVQYGETDLDFIKRLLEELGIYFYFEYDDNAATMVLADQPSTHPQPGLGDSYPYYEEVASGMQEQIYTWTATERAVTGKVTLRDYDFTKPSSDLTATTSLPSGTHSHKSYESYRYPGVYKDVSDGEERTAALVEEQASDFQTWSATSNVLNINVGKILEILDHPRHLSAADNGFMVTKMAQFVTVLLDTVPGGSTLINDPAYGGDLADALGVSAQTSEDKKAVFRGQFQTVFEAVKKSIPYRGASATPRPVMNGVQTAFVTGAQGDEIKVDKYGRIKVQFHWDREGKKDDKTTCWVRTMMPWTGKGWGMVGLPRVGQEVVIQFEEGNPDRPLCVGMLYNAETMPPYELPANATRTGIKTNSSKGGGGYNELMFEDKKGDELVRFMAEKDYVQNVQNQAHIKVGYDHATDVKKGAAQADRSMKLEVENHLDEIVDKGNHSFEVKSGTQDIKIKKNKTETNSAKSTLTVTGDKTTTVTQGNVKETVKTGNKETTVKLGNISVDASLGKIDMEAMQSITLKVGPSEIKIDMQGVTISGPMINIKGDISVGIKSLMTEVKGDAMLTLKGGVTMIN